MASSPRWLITPRLFSSLAWGSYALHKAALGADAFAGPAGDGGEVNLVRFLRPRDAGDAHLAAILVWLVVQVFKVGVGGDGGVAFLPVAMRCCHDSPRAALSSARSGSRVCR